MRQERAQPSPGFAAQIRPLPKGEVGPSARRRRGLPLIAILAGLAVGAPIGAVAEPAHSSVHDASALAAKILNAPEPRAPIVEAQGSATREFEEWSRRNQAMIALFQAGDWAKAAEQAESTLKFAEKTFGREDTLTLMSVGNAALMNVLMGRYTRAEALYRRALDVYERALGPDADETLGAVNGLAMVYFAQGRYDAADPLFVRVLAARERQFFGVDNPETADAIGNLAALRVAQRRYDEAEPLIKRQIAGRERHSGMLHPRTLDAVGNLATLYALQHRYAEAEPLMKRALDASAASNGADHPNTLNWVGNLGGLYVSQGRFAEAEPLLKRALAGTERALGRDNPLTLGAARNLAHLHERQKRHGEAEPLYRRALSGFEKIGAEHPQTLQSLSMYFSWRAAANADRHQSGFAGDSGAARLLGANLKAFDGYLVAGVDKARLADPSSLEWRASALVGAFERSRRAGVAGADEVAAASVTQRLTLSSVASALAASSARLANPARRALLEERTRLGREIADRLKALDQVYAASPRNLKAESAIKADIAELRNAALAITTELRKGDAGRAEIDGVVDAEDLRALGKTLPAGEALILYSSVGGRYIGFVASRRGTAAHSLDATPGDIAAKVEGLRKGLRLPFRMEGGKEVPSSDPRDLPPFDLDLAAELHRLLIAPLAGALEGATKLVIVADGPLQSLPFAALVERAGDPGLPRFERLRASRYLVDRYAVSLQPSVSAIRTLRAKTPRAGGDRPLLGFADPVLKPGQGAGGPRGAAAPPLIIEMGGPGDAGALENLPALPQTRALLDAIGASMGVPAEDLRYAEKASEADFRALDEALPDYRIIAFATHALVSNEIEALKLNEPALVMSLPPVSPGAERPWENDGLLRASDIVGFEMDADLVILAACNTAAPDGTPGAEPLSGLAKAFMLRGARALLVSHWQADANSSAVLIPEMTRLAAEAGFSEGLARAQRELRAGAETPFNLHYAHPAMWAAFTLIGDPGR